jgi:serine/threonine-protein kinase
MKALDIHVLPRGTILGNFPVDFPGGEAPSNREPFPVPVREGPSSEVRLFARWGRLPEGTLLVGRLYIGGGRVHGRFTEALTPSGEAYTVCLALWERGQQGIEMDPSSTPDKVLINPVQGVKPVKRFE